MQTSNSLPHPPIVMISAVIATAGVFVIALGFMHPLLALILKKQGFSATLIGVNSAMAPLGIILSAPLIPRLADHIGAARLAVLCAALSTILLALIGAFQHIFFWFFARFALGMVINGTYVMSETWVNTLATTQNRGRIMGFYTAVLSAGFALGPFILAGTGTEGWLPFLVVITIMLITTFVLLFIRSRLPEFPVGKQISIRSFLPLAPILMAAIGIIAFFDQTVLALLPVYGLHFGLTERFMVVAVGVLISGNVLLQYPIGWIADCQSRRSVMIGCALMTVAGSLSLPFVITSTVLLWPLLFIWGAVAFGVYTVALAELGDRFSGRMLLVGNAAFAMMWGIGGVIGPPVAGGSMDLFGPHGLPATFGVVYLLLAIIVALGQPVLKEARATTK